MGGLCFRKPFIFSILFILIRVFLTTTKIKTRNALKIYSILPMIMLTNLESKIFKGIIATVDF